VSDKVLRISDLDLLTERLLRYLPDDRVAIAHGDFKMDNFVRRWTSTSLSGHLSNGSIAACARHVV